MKLLNLKNEIIYKAKTYKDLRGLNQKIKYEDGYTVMVTFGGGHGGRNKTYGATKENFKEDETSLELKTITGEFVKLIKRHVVIIEKVKLAHILITDNRRVILEEVVALRKNEKIKEILAGGQNTNLPDRVLFSYTC